MSCKEVCKPKTVSLQYSYIRLVTCCYNVNKIVSFSLFEFGLKRKIVLSFAVSTQVVERLIKHGCLIDLIRKSFMEPS